MWQAENHGEDKQPFTPTPSDDLLVPEAGNAAQKTCCGADEMENVDVLDWVSQALAAVPDAVKVVNVNAGNHPDEQANPGVGRK